MRVCNNSRNAIPIVGAAPAELICWNQAPSFVVFLVTSIVIIVLHFRLFQSVSSFSTGVSKWFSRVFPLMGLDDNERERERERDWTVWLRPTPRKAATCGKRHVSADHRASPFGRTKKKGYEKKKKKSGGKWAWHERGSKDLSICSDVFKCRKQEIKSNQIKSSNKNKINPESHVNTAENGLSFLCHPDTYRKRNQKILLQWSGSSAARQLMIVVDTE